MGFLLGTVFLDSVDLMTPEMMDDVSDEEKAYGWWEENFYGWRITKPVEFEYPIPIRGRQGIYDWSGDSDALQKGCSAPDQTRPPDLRSGLQVI
jgi:hypothetical protein